MNAANSQILFIILLFVFLAGTSAIGIYVIYSLRKRNGKADPDAESNMFEDPSGIWWYLDPEADKWHWWTGEEWSPTETGPNMKKRPKRKRPGNNRSCAVTLAVIALLVIVIGGGISLLGFEFFPGYSIPTSVVFNQSRVIRFGGGGLLLLLIGGFMVRYGSWGLIAQQESIETETRDRSKAMGCVSLITGFILVFIGIIAIGIGIGLMALIIIQEILPTIGEMFNLL